MPAPYTLKQLTDVDDSAVKFGFAEIQEARFATGDLEASDTGLALHRIKDALRKAGVGSVNDATATEPQP